MAEDARLNLSLGKQPDLGQNPSFLTCLLSENIQDAIPALDRKYSSGSHGQETTGWFPEREAAEPG